MITLLRNNAPLSSPVAVFLYSTTGKKQSAKDYRQKTISNTFLTPGIDSGVSTSHIMTDYANEPLT